MDEIDRPPHVEQHGNTLYEWKTTSDLPRRNDQRAFLWLLAIWIVLIGCWAIVSLVAVLG